MIFENGSSTTILINWIEVYLKRFTQNLKQIKAVIWKKFHGSQKQQVILRTTLAPWVWLKKTLTKTWKWKIRYNQLHWWLSKTGKSFHLKHQAGSWYVFWVWQACSSVFAIDVNRSHQILYKSILTLTATYRQCIERITCVMSHWKKEILQLSTCDKYLNLIFSVIFLT